ncbi:hypothetical protein EYZ11_003296 [Aspergillus tanneri]|uniref:Diaminohydroxyphosphoribosylamino-pyrimidine deaminase n=1 Tax=Aspergillus tanneri TaxID=1220188 RepID=A0A4S3JNP3_9EURO|nr:uncharacterized protein ATNIH1004_003202 [Aspergillus tanneri]KAA8650515.1 hypothetical protein ATNIH1004_003202 [Aspergillus tanneri]THC97243.1 hypothetical protein EYZ11_003296 [Aspergillus tanneri]
MEELSDLITSLGPAVEDAEEESFLLFSQDIPSANLGFVDSRATSVEITIRGQDYTIYQSPSLLSSSRAGGTTGAVLWKITPLFAEWISSQSSSPLWKHSLLSSSSTVVELGCGISGLIALALAPTVQYYIATDQEYVQRLFRENIDSNVSSTPRNQPSSSQSKGRKRGGLPDQKSKRKEKLPNKPRHNITFTSLDWELDIPSSLKHSLHTETPVPREVKNSSNKKNDNDNNEDEDKGFDLLLSCDCIYNEALVAPFVRTCADICRLRPVFNSTRNATQSARSPTICLIAQQQRSPDVFEAWLQETMRFFHVWRVSDEMLGDQLKLGTGYLVHLLLLREGA